MAKEDEEFFPEGVIQVETIGVRQMTDEEKRILLEKKKEAKKVIYN